MRSRMTARRPVGVCACTLAWRRFGTRRRHRDVGQGGKRLLRDGGMRLGRVVGNARCDRCHGRDGCDRLQRCRLGGVGDCGIGNKCVASRRARHDVHDLEPARLELGEQRRQRRDRDLVNIVQQQDAAASGFEPAQRAAHDLLRRDAPLPVVAGEIGAPGHDPALAQIGF
jgi:hypothetical protein